MNQIQAPNSSSPGHVRAIAFYLPQYHPIQENDEWWGAGFTEWTNVAQAKPLYRGHYQPHIPRDLGFYDLRLSEARQNQADLARQHGIHGFCYYHYWFNSRRLLERPFQEVLETGHPDYPFCLCWANENWTRVWDGQEKQVLMRQSYGEADDRSHIQALLPAFADSRYIRVSGKPLFLVYRSRRLPDPRRTTDVWREEAIRQGVGELFLVKVDSFPDENVEPGSAGFDAAVEFQPDWGNLGAPLRRSLPWRAAARLGLSSVHHTHLVFRYPDVVNRMLASPRRSYFRFPCVTPGWDNTARRKAGAAILDGSTPDEYERWLRAVVQAFRPPEPGHDLVFINAWNEWGEGNHLEPDLRWGRGYLEATRRVMLSGSGDVGTMPAHVRQHNPA